MKSRASKVPTKNFDDCACQATPDPLSYALDVDQFILMETFVGQFGNYSRNLELFGNTFKNYTVTLQHVSETLDEANIYIKIFTYVAVFYHPAYFLVSAVQLVSYITACCRGLDPNRPAR